jgi:hypothetical protein
MFVVFTQEKGWSECTRTDGAMLAAGEEDEDAGPAYGGFPLLSPWSLSFLHRGVQDLLATSHPSFRRGRAARADPKKCLFMRPPQQEHEGISALVTIARFSRAPHSPASSPTRACGARPSRRRRRNFLLLMAIGGAGWSGGERGARAGGGRRRARGSSLRHPRACHRAHADADHRCDGMGACFLMTTHARLRRWLNSASNSARPTLTVRPSGRATAPPANSTAATRWRSAARYASTSDAISCMP